MNKGEWEKAIADLDAAIRLDAGQPFPHFNRGFAYFRQGKFEKAIADYDEAIRLEPKYADAYRDRGYARAMSGKPREGLRDLNRAIELNPQDQAAYNSRGAAYAGWPIGIWPSPTTIAPSSSTPRTPPPGPTAATPRP